MQSGLDGRDAWDTSQSTGAEHTSSLVHAATSKPCAPSQGETMGHVRVVRGISGDPLLALGRKHLHKGRDSSMRSKPDVLGYWGSSNAQNLCSWVGIERQGVLRMPPRILNPQPQTRVDPASSNGNRAPASLVVDLGLNC